VFDEAASHPPFGRSCLLRDYFPFTLSAPIFLFANLRPRNVNPSTRQTRKSLRNSDDAAVELGRTLGRRRREKLACDTAAETARTSSSNGGKRTGRHSNTDTILESHGSVSWNRSVPDNYFFVVIVSELGAVSVLPVEEILVKHWPISTKYACPGYCVGILPLSWSHPR